MPQLTTSATARGALVAVGGATGTAAVYALGVLTARGQRVEQAILDASSFAAGSALLGLVTVPSLVAACAVVAAVALGRRRPTLAVAVVGMVAVSNALGQVLKHQVLERPTLTVEATNTFPSGHMIAFASVSLAVLLVLPARARPVVALATTAVLCLVGTQMIHFGWHRPSDLVGSLSLVVGSSAVAWLLAGRDVGDPHDAGARPAGVLIGVGVTAAVVTAGLGLLHATRLLPTASWPVTAFGHGTVLVAAPLAVAAMLWLVAAPADRPTGRARPSRPPARTAATTRAGGRP